LAFSLPVALSALLLLAASPLYATLSIHPDAPTSGEGITLLSETLCIIDSHSVTRAGNEISVTLEHGSCPTPPFVRAYEVPLGPLPAGRYHVVVDGTDELSFIVRDSAPGLRVRPSVVPTNTPGFRLELETANGFSICSLAECQTMLIELGGVTFRVQDTIGLPGPISIIAPNLPPGWKDVRVTNNSGSFEFPAAVYYHAPGSSPDIFAFERILFPVLFSTGGANGSSWRSEALIVNPTRWTIENANEVLPIVCVTYPCGERLSPRSRTGFTGEGYPHGVALLVPRAEAESIGFTLRVRDVSREADNLGTEVPVVRENAMMRDVDIPLLNVPRDPRYRTKVRVYAFPEAIRVGQSDPMLRILGSDGSVLAETGFTLERNCGDAPGWATPCYGEVDLAVGTKDEHSDVYVQLPAGWLGWAFASVTNNVTQQVTIVSPGGKGGRPGNAE
jgi:hypothetical protein